MFNTQHTATVQIPQGSFQVTSAHGQSGAMLDAMMAAQARAGQIAWDRIEETFAQGRTVAGGAAVQINCA